MSDYEPMSDAEWLRKELFAARAERDALLVQRNDAMAAVMRAVDMKIAAEAERDELRELLVETRDLVIAEGVLEYNDPFIVSIDAALNKGGGDE